MSIRNYLLLLGVFFQFQVFAQLGLQSTVEYQTIEVLTGKKEYLNQGLIKERGSVQGRRLSKNFLKAQLSSLGYTPFEHTYVSKNDGSNIYALRPAQGEVFDKNIETIIVGAHFDSVGNAGANDNASGVGVVMGLAHFLKDQDFTQKNFVLIFFDEEESGLIGANHFAEKIFNEKWNVHSVHTIDQIAWDEDGDGAIELEKAPEDLFEFYQSVNEKYDLDIPLLRSNVTSTDHHAFRRLGFTALGITEEYAHGDTTPCYHHACDTFETINWNYLLSASKLMSLVMKELSL